MRLKLRTATVGLLLGAALALPQGIDATVSGAITDPSGAAVANVKVLALHQETGIVTSTASNQAGVYDFASLPPGKYRITAERAGFRTAVINDVELEVGARVTRGASSEMNTTSSSVGDVVGGQKLLALPVAGRSSYDLIATQPGVIQGAGTNGSYNMNGNRGGSVNFTDAEYGRSAGQIQVITRGASNAFHGTPRNVLYQNQTGVRLGGPVKRNRTFFNGIFEGQKQSQILAVTQTVYTQAARQGIFRFFPGVQNGNPVRPAAATGSLQSISVLGRDPNRLAVDPGTARVQGWSRHALYFRRRL